MSNPFDAFDAPTASTQVAPAKQAANPFDQFDAQQKPSTGYGKGLTRAVVQGVTFGFGDEAEAWLRSLSGADRELALAKIRDEMDAFKKENPKTAFAAELAGGVAVPGLGAAKLIGGAATMGGKMLRSGAVGAVHGGVSGAGHNEDADKLATDVAVGAGIGGTIGAAVPAATSAASKLLAKAMPSRRAADTLAHGVERDAQAAGISTADEIARIRAATAGPHDAVSGSQTLATALGDEARAAASQGMRGSAGAGGRVQRAADELRDARPGTPQYDALYRGADVGGAEAQQIAALIASRPALRQAAAIAERAVANSGGTMAPTGQYSRQFLDQLDRALIDRVNSSSRAGNGNASTIYGNVQGELRDILRSATPDLMGTKSAYARGTRAAEAVESTLPGSAQPRGVDAGEAVGAVGSLVRGNLGTATMRIISLLGRGTDEAKAQRIADALLTRFNEPARLAAAIDALERMTPTARRHHLDRLLTGGVTAGVTGDRVTQ